MIKTGKLALVVRLVVIMSVLSACASEEPQQPNEQQFEQPTAQTLPIDDRPTDDVTIALETIEFSHGRLLREDSLPWVWNNGELVHESDRVILFIAWRMTDVDRWSGLIQDDETAGLALPLHIMSRSLAHSGLNRSDLDVVILALNDPVGTTIEAHPTDLFDYAAGAMHMDELLLRVAFTVSS